MQMVYYARRLGTVRCQEFGVLRRVVGDKAMQTLMERSVDLVSQWNRARGERVQRESHVDARAREGLRWRITQRQPNWLGVRINRSMCQRCDRGTDWGGRGVPKVSKVRQRLIELLDPFILDVVAPYLGARSVL